MDTEALKNFYRFQDSRWVGPLYYDHPDGEDLAGKISFCGQVGFILSAPIGVVNAYNVYPYPTSTLGRFARILRVVMPGTGMGIAFAAATFYATTFRQKDDPFNHAIGGIAAGMIFGAVKGFLAGCSMSLILATAAVTYKHNYNDLKKKHSKGATKMFSPYFMRSKDFYGYPEKGDNWVKAPAPEM